MSRPIEAVDRRDRETRRLAQSEFTRPLMVEAGAGTGKTALLVARVVAWCVGPGWVEHERPDRPPDAVARRVAERVVAITFTEAAAAEMARKIGEALAELASGSGRVPIGWQPDPDQLPADEVLVARAGALAQEAHRLRASTIHGFCQRLIRTHPIEAGVHPYFEVDPDGTRLEEIITAVVEEALRGLGQDPARTHWERLAGAGVGPPETAAAVRKLIDDGVTAASLEKDPFSLERVQAAAAQLLAAAEALLAAEGGRLQGIRAPTSAATLGAVQAMVAGLRGLDGGSRLEELLEAARPIGDGERRRLASWSKLDLGKQESERLAGVEADFAVAAGDLAAILDGLAEVAPEALAAARAVLATLMNEVERRRRAAGVVTFADQLRRADGLLDSSPGVRREVRAGIDQLLVDEFQDTDQVQCRIVRLLALDGPVAERPGLFVVGDPKQSIYAWRNADLRAYDEFVALVRRCRGRVEPLVRNFRSHRPILDEVEAVVAPVMRAEHGVQPAFEALQATGERIVGVGFDRAPWSAVEHWAAWPADEGGPPAPYAGTQRPVNALEAVAIAEDIRRLHDHAEVAFKNVAVLLRATTGQEVLLEAFRERGVPYEVAREREYYRQREVVEAAALVRCLLEPTDTLALVTVLRSDVVGVPDAALGPLWQEGLPSRMARLSGADPGELAEVLTSVDRAAARVDGSLPGLASLPRWPQALRAAVAAVAELRRSLQADPPDVFVERLRTVWLAEVTAAARFLGGFRRARLDRFLADLEQRLMAGDGGQALLARFLRRAVAEGAASTVTAEPDLSADAVHVMTIHGAKGLDFEHVYLVQTHRGGRGGGRGTRTDTGSIGGRLEYRLFGWPTLGYGALRRLTVRQEHAERVRLLYVAMTRAKQRLVVSGAWKDPGGVRDPLVAATFGELVAHRGEAEALEAQAAAGEVRRRASEPGVQWVLPALMELGGGAATRAADDGLDRELVARVRRDAAALASARESASVRMVRPLVGAASALGHAALERQDAEETASGASEGGGEAALAVGTAVHRFLERLDLGRELAPQVAELGERIRAEVRTAVGVEFADLAVRRVEDLLQRLAGGACLQRLGSVAGAVVARELPVLLPVADAGGPVAAISGFIDLVYRDPDDGRLVVADYKTDRFEPGSDLSERAAVYEPQLRTYARALRTALGLESEPLAELWFLHADRIVRI